MRDGIPLGFFSDCDPSSTPLRILHCWRRPAKDEATDIKVILFPSTMRLSTVWLSLKPPGKIFIEMMFNSGGLSNDFKYCLSQVLSTRLRRSPRATQILFCSRRKAERLSSWRSERDVQRCTRKTRANRSQVGGTAHGLMCENSLPVDGPLTSASSFAQQEVASV